MFCSIVWRYDYRTSNHNDNIVFWSKSLNIVWDICECDKRTEPHTKNRLITRCNIVIIRHVENGRNVECDFWVYISALAGAMEECRSVVLFQFIRSMCYFWHKVSTQASNHDSLSFSACTCSCSPTQLHANFFSPMCIVLLFHCLAAAVLFLCGIFSSWKKINRWKIARVEWHESSSNGFVIITCDYMLSKTNRTLHRNRFGKLFPLLQRSKILSVCHYLQVVSMANCYMHLECICI